MIRAVSYILVGNVYKDGASKIKNDT